MVKSFFLAALAGVAILVSAMAPAQAAMVSVPGAAATQNDIKSPLIHKTQRRGRVRRGRGRFRGSRRRGRRGRGAAIGAGIAIGVLGAIAASEAHAAERRHRRRCNRWRRQCYNGSDRACWKYEDRC